MEDVTIRLPIRSAPGGLDAEIIDYIHQRERARQERRDQPQERAPDLPEYDPGQSSEKSPGKSDRGVAIIPLYDDPGASRRVPGGVYC